MSQINDALKRAQDIQTKATPSTVPPMLPAESKNESNRPGWVWPVVIILFVLLFVGIFLAVSPGSHEPQKTAADPVAATAPVVEPAPAPKPAPVEPVAPAAAAPAPKPVRLQGIVYDPVHPYAIISGKTVFVGDLVDGQRVTAISSDAVTLTANGQTNQLRVGQR